MLLTAMSGASGLYYAFTAPKVYKAETLLYVFGTSLRTQGISQIWSAITGGGGAGQPDYLEKLLSSDTLALAVAKKLRLDKVAEFSDLDKKQNHVKRENKKRNTKTTKSQFAFDLRKPQAQKLLSKLKKNVVVRYDKKAVISITCEALDGYVAANIANTYVEILRSKMTSKGTKNVKFLKGQLDKMKRDLLAADDKLRKFQEKNKVVVLEKQLEIEVQEYMNLKSDQLRNQMSLDATQKLIQSSGSLEDLAQFEGEKILYETRQTELEHALQQFDVNLQTYPEKAQQFARSVREVKVLELIFQLISQQYEMERISQLRDDVDFQVLDKAFPPDKHFKPQKKAILIVSLSVGFFAGIVLIFLLEMMKNKDVNEMQDINNNNLSDV